MVEGPAHPDQKRRVNIQVAWQQSLSTGLHACASGSLRSDFWAIPD
jgi:hypothetical protein